MESPYNILKKLCAVRNSCMAVEQDTHETPRAMFIRETLDSMNVKYEVDTFRGDGEMGVPMSNISVFLNSKFSKETVMFIAHHDVNNPDSDNCQDNSASIANLIALAGKLNGMKLNRNVAIVFTDSEECGKYGAKRLCGNIEKGYYNKVEYVINLELTANGNEIWCDQTEGNLVDHLENVVCNGMEKTLWCVNTPTNDSVALRERGIDSVCIGILPVKDINDAFESGYCKTWGLCHRESDEFVNADRESMENFVEFLTYLI